MKFTGVIRNVDNTSFKSKNGETVNKVILFIEEQVQEYAQTLAIGFFGKTIDQTDCVYVNDVVEVEYNIRSIRKDYNGEIRHYVSLNGRKVKKVEGNLFSDKDKPVEKEDTPDDLPF